LAILNNLLVNGVGRILNKLYCNDLEVSGDLDISGDTTIDGTLTLRKTQDASGTANNSPALIVGGIATSNHLEFDYDEIMAKKNGTTVGNLYLNHNGGTVYMSNNGNVSANNGTLTATTVTGTTVNAGTLNADTIKGKTNTRYNMSISEDGFYLFDNNNGTIHDIASFFYNSTDGMQIAIGTRSSDTYGYHSFTIGSSCTASGMFSLSMGDVAKATGDYSIAIGRQAMAKGSASTSIGYRALASDDNSFAIGYNVVAANDYNTVIGKFNKATVSGSGTSAIYSNVGDYAFTIGNGTADTTAGRSNALTVDWSGNMILSGSLTCTNVHPVYHHTVTSASDVCTITHNLNISGTYYPLVQVCSASSALFVYGVRNCTANSF